MLPHNKHGIEANGKGQWQPPCLSIRYYFIGVSSIGANSGERPEIASAEDALSATQSPSEQSALRPQSFPQKAATIRGCERIHARQTGHGTRICRPILPPCSAGLSSSPFSAHRAFIAGQSDLIRGPLFSADRALLLRTALCGRHLLSAIPCYRKIRHFNRVARASGNGGTLRLLEVFSGTNARHNRE